MSYAIYESYVHDFLSTTIVTQYPELKRITIGKHYSQQFDCTYTQILF